MRSRYSAFVTKNFDYLNETQHPQTRSPKDIEANQQWAEAVTFTGLEILRSSEDGNKGMVEFKAHYKDTASKEAIVHHEISSFRKQAGLWYFREGKLQKDPKAQ